LTALPITSAGRFWLLGPLGIAILPVPCALSHVLNGHHGRSAFVRLILYMNGDHLVRVASISLRHRFSAIFRFSSKPSFRFGMWVTLLSAKHIGASA
jgi:hypothetical protein